jgi:trehalose 6-phosphate synthase/phosphatase
MVSSRLLIVSNRLPVTARLGRAGVELTAASGGLATGLSPWHRQSAGLWIGWPGDVSSFSGDQVSELERLLEAQSIVPVFLTADNVDRYYHGFANGVLWPLFHYLIDRVPVQATGWDAYRQVNEAFADAVIREYHAGDRIWVHDYQLMLVPALLRARLPQAQIGFFLHIPFPSSEVFRILPWRKEVLTGILGADLVGFHTFSYLRHFATSLLHIDGIEADIDRVRAGDRDVRLGVFPMGIDSTAFAALAADPEVTAEAAAIRADAGGRRILLAVDRLDYTKGIPRRLQAVARLLTLFPELRDSIRCVQVAVPSRGEVDSYQRFRRQVEEMVGRINGQCGTVRSSPVHYIHDSVSIRQLVALYSAADVMLVTPLRDGMNLVAKEFLASRIDEDGVLVLSELTGAAAELGDAIVVNPYDIDGVAEAIRLALTMPREERRARMRSMRARVMTYDVQTWAGEFIAGLGTGQAPESSPHIGTHAALTAALAAGRTASGLHLLLDYDGTLVPLAPTPDLAAPDAELMTLLGDLCSVGGAKVEIVSGRTWQTLQSWFGKLPLTLWAEHGFWRRAAPGDSWQATTTVKGDWMDKVWPILEQFTAGTPGSWIETKTASIAWHYRAAAHDFGERQAHELRMLLGDALSNQPLEVLQGKKVIEMRLRGVSKALVAERISHDDRRMVVSFGDDRTDEDLFEVLPTDSVTVAVGQPLRGARFLVDDYRAVRQVLRTLLPPEALSGSATGPPPGLGRRRRRGTAFGIPILSSPRRTTPFV